MDVLLSVVAEEQYNSCAGGPDTAMYSAGVVGSSYPAAGNGTSTAFMGGEGPGGRVSSTQSWGSSGQAVRGASDWYASASRPQASWGGGAGDRPLQYGGQSVGQTPRAHSGYANSSYNHSYQVQRTHPQQQQHQHQSQPQGQPYTNAPAAAHNDVASRRQVHSTTTTTPPRLPERNGYVNHHHQFTNGMSYAASSTPGSAGKKRPRVEDWSVASPVAESRRSESHSDIHRRFPPQSSPVSPDAAPRHASQQGASLLQFAHTSQGWQVERPQQQHNQQQQQQQQQRRHQQQQQQQRQQQQQQQQQQQLQQQQQRWYIKQEGAHNDEGGEIVSLNYLLKAPAFARRPSSPPASPPPPAMEPPLMQQPVMQPPPREVKKRMTVEVGSKEWYDDVRARAMGFLKREINEEKAVGLIQGETKLRLDVGLGGRVLKDWEGCGRIGCEAPARPRSRYCSNTCGILEAQTMLWHALSDCEHEEEQRIALDQHVPAGIGSTSPLLFKRESVSFSPVVDEDDAALRAHEVLAEGEEQVVGRATVVARDGVTRDEPKTTQGGMLCGVKEKPERRVNGKVECGVSEAGSNDGGISVTCVCCRAELDPDELEVHLRERCLVHSAYARTRVAYE